MKCFSPKEEVRAAGHGLAGAVAAPDSNPDSCEVYDFEALAYNHLKSTSCAKDLVECRAPPCSQNHLLKSNDKCRFMNDLHGPTSELRQDPGPADYFCSPCSESDHAHHRAAYSRHNQNCNDSREPNQEHMETSNIPYVAPMAFQKKVWLTPPLHSSPS